MDIPVGELGHLHHILPQSDWRIQVSWVLQAGARYRFRILGYEVIFPLMFGDSDDGVDSGEQRDLITIFRPQVANPAAAHYGFAPNPACNLVNGAGLPASSFRARTNQNKNPDGVSARW